MSAPEPLTAPVAEGITPTKKTKTAAEENVEKQAVKEKHVSYFSLFRYAKRILTVLKVHFDLFDLMVDPFAAVEAGFF